MEKEQDTSKNAMKDRIEGNKERVIDISVGEQHRKNVNRVME